jgi:hypothetical protein
MKSKTLLQSGKDKRFDKIGEGDLVFALQANRVNETEKGYQIETNLDWSFDDKTTPLEIKSSLGSFLSTIEDIFGEKMVTEAILHYAEERNHLVITPQGAGLNFKSKGLKFKNWKEVEN